jgi:hypothetical protein
MPRRTSKNIVVIDGCRTPSSLASMLYKNDLAVGLGKYVFPEFIDSNKSISLLKSGHEG